ncbi:MAG: tyrosine-type recombinase/integrase [Paludibacter sp.]
MTTINNDFDILYIPARICEGKDLCIKYYAWHPVEKKQKRIVVRFNHLKGKMNKRDLMRHIRKIANDININLAAGRNPFVESETPKAFHKLSDAVDQFLKLKKRDMRPDGLRSYTSYCKKLNAWLDSHKLKECYVISFTTETALELMNELALNDCLNNRTWNNHFVFYRSLWNWMIENKYCKMNVFESFSKKREEEKFRIVIPKLNHYRIAMYCRWFMPHMEIVIDLVRASFIRPKEISLIQIKEIDLFKKVIFIPASKSKTHRDRFAYLPDWLCGKIIDNFQFDRFSLDDYFIGKDLNPAPININTRDIDKFWNKIRKDLRLPDEMQLYSYRDTGITFLEDAGIQRKVIQKLTDHTSEKMVGKYIGQPSQELIDNVVSKIRD